MHSKLKWIPLFRESYTYVLRKGKLNEAINKMLDMHLCAKKNK